MAEEENLDVLKSFIGTQAKVSRTLNVQLQRSKISKASTESKVNTAAKLLPKSPKFQRMRETFAIFCL